MDAKQEARRLFQEYNSWRLQTGGLEKRRAEGKYVGAFKETPERVQIFLDMAAWCREQSIDPRLWLYLLFRSRGWTFAPQMTPSHLQSKTMIPRYARFMEHGNLDGYRLHVVQTQKHVTEKFDPNWEISYTVEALKDRYLALGQAQRCMRETLERTYGYHPKSKVCNVCPLRQQCALQLQRLVPEFDIIALRDGKMSPAEAQSKVHTA